MSTPLPSSPAGPLAQQSHVRYDAAGLVPVVVQDAGDGRVLMLAWASAAAVAATLATGDLYFYSRSRSALWRKGETSGNTLRLVDLALDCDGDALLARVEASGPTCHRLERSCFDRDGTAGPGQRLAPSPISGDQGFAWLENLWATIVDRATTQPEGSYTARLLAAGVDGPARKVAEEATEVLMAAKDDAVAAEGSGDHAATQDALVGEVADLVYHLLVLLAERGILPTALIERLQSRHGS